MVLAFPTVESRILHVRAATKCPSGAAFAKWIGANSPQAVGKWIERQRLPADALKLLNAATGADVGWLLNGKGEPFPGGVTPYPGALPATAEPRLQVIEDQLDAMKAVMARVLELLSAKLPTVGPDLAAMLAALPGETEAKREVFATAAAAAAEGLLSAVSASRSGVRVESRGTPPRKGR